LKIAHWYHELTAEKLLIGKIGAVYRERSSTLGLANSIMIRPTIIGNVEALKIEVPPLLLSIKPKFL
jgi:hypothetical protein